MKVKTLIQSKTFWFNTLTAVLAAASLFGFGEFTPDAKVTEGIVAFTGIVNIILRLKTNTAIKGIK